MDNVSSNEAGDASAFYRHVSFFFSSAFHDINDFDDLEMI